MNPLSKLEKILALVAVGLVALLVFDLVARKHGAEACVNGDKATVAAAIVKLEPIKQAGAIAEVREEDRHAAALNSPLAPTPHFDGVQPAPLASCPRAVPRPAAAQPGGPGAALVRAAEPTVVVSEDGDAFVRSNVQRDATADETVRHLQRELRIRDATCRGQKPPEGP